VRTCLVFNSLRDSKLNLRRVWREIQTWRRQRKLFRYARGFFIFIGSRLKAFKYKLRQIMMLENGTLGSFFAIAKRAMKNLFMILKAAH
jgi:hypothetical protein